MSVNLEQLEPDGGPGISKLISRIVQGIGTFLGCAFTTWTFLFLLGRSFEYGAGLERATVVIPVLSLGLFLVLCRRRRRPLARWFLLQFFAASLITYLIMQFVVINLI